MEGAVLTRQGGNININRCKTKEKQKMFLLLHDGFKMYNEVSKEIKSEQRLNIYL